MGDVRALELAEIAASAGTLRERAEEMLDRLGRLTPFDAAWMALTEPLGTGYRSLASIALDEVTDRFLGGPTMADDIDRTRTNRPGPPLSPSDLPFPAAELVTWAECLVPAGFQQALAVALYTSDRRHVGFLTLLSSSARPPSPASRQVLQDLTPVLARAIDPLRSLAISARLLNGATAGAALCRDGSHCLLPGLRQDELLVDGSPVTEVARAYLADGQVFASFLWPSRDRQAPDSHVRVTVLAASGDTPAGLMGAVVLSRAMDVHGLTPRELVVLGLVIEGRSNQQIAHALVVTPRTVATHLEHILVKLDAPTRTLAAVRAHAQGLYVPSYPAAS
ncbi:helix-turn-helix transcriptional regulator [Nakamurella endophytica]|uniref:HTH luxR-type domain-containing protein n=1 Tax=Nakamurella endophytica TaxID=1748367 RepID=A0A917WKR4_9ACTN|nr:helix-turn-helix transcriptional regulator [Nakamurella endophytica]GGM11410.1 hypothetical protein GCM10011594_34180 [Nakamurella endophytica]